MDLENRTITNFKTAKGFDETKKPYHLQLDIARALHPASFPKINLGEGFSLIVQVSFIFALLYLP